MKQEPTSKAANIIAVALALIVVAVIAAAAFRLIRWIVGF